MERTEVLDMMSGLKLYGMRGAPTTKPSPRRGSASLSVLTESNLNS